MRAKSGAIAVVFAALFFMGACTTEDSDASITVVNDSQVDLIELNVAPVGTVTWGGDLFGGADLFPGEELTVVVACDYYDIRIVDEFGVECIVEDADLCANDSVLYANADCGL